MAGHCSVQFIGGATPSSVLFYRIILLLLFDVRMDWMRGDWNGLSRERLYHQRVAHNTTSTLTLCRSNGRRRRSLALLYIPTNMYIGIVDVVILWFGWLLVEGESYSYGIGCWHRGYWIRERWPVQNIFVFWNDRGKYLFIFSREVEKGKWAIIQRSSKYTKTSESHWLLCI